MSEVLVVLGICLIIVLLLALAVMGFCVSVELKRQQIARERARSEARLHMYTSAAMQRMYDAARQAQERSS